MSSKKQNFENLDEIDDATRDLLLAAKATIETSQAMMTTSVFEVGAQLCAVKDTVGHGVFGQWIAAEFKFGIRTAEKQMSVHSSLATHQQLLQHYSLSTLYALSAASVDKKRSKIIREIADGKLSTDEAVIERIVALVPKKEVDPQVLEERQNNLTATVRLISHSVGEQLPMLIDLLRKIGASKLADELQAFSLDESDSQESTPETPEAPGFDKGEEATADEPPAAHEPSETEEHANSQAAAGPVTDEAAHLTDAESQHSEQSEPLEESDQDVKVNADGDEVPDWLQTEDSSTKPRY